MIKRELIVETQEEFDRYCEIWNAHPNHKVSKSDGFALCMIKDHKTFKIADYAPPKGTTVIAMGSSECFYSTGHLGPNGKTLRVYALGHKTYLSDWKWANSIDAIRFLMHKINILDMGCSCSFEKDFINQSIRISKYSELNVIIKIKEVCECKTEPIFKNDELVSAWNDDKAHPKPFYIF